MGRLRIFLLLLCSVVAFAAIFPAVTSADTLPDTKNKGLYISPLRSYLSLGAGTSVTRSFTVANLTDSPMPVTTHIERFSMVDYSYDYNFSKVNNDWVHLAQTTATLAPYESRQFVYTVTLPKDAAPGGYYYSLFASTSTTSGGTTNTVQAASLLYLTVKGDMTYDFAVSNPSIPAVVTGPSIKYSFDVTNTGNVHYFAMVSAAVDGLFYHDAPNGTSQLLMPGAVRRISASINSPLLPGIYKLTYTIAPDHGQALTKSQFFIHAPLWSIIALFFAIVLYGRYHKRKHTSTPPKEQ